ncbi:MAG: hypothetical protein EOM25_09350 [Deltaproteobacteria bacterium]|nr:hypothetical protein [Deltaproteobacteria bacterium]
MTGIDRWTVDSLLCEIRTGILPGRLAPRSGIWPGHDAAVRLGKLTSFNVPDLSPVLLASHLLDPAATPGEIRPWLRAQAEQWTGLPLGDLESATWKLVPLILLAGDDAVLEYSLVGLGRNLPVILGHQSTILDSEALRAVELVRAWCWERHGQEAAFWPLVCGRKICGPSLGLPMALGIVAAFEDFPFPPVLASGAVEMSGRLLPVDGLRVKIGLARRLGRSLLAPLSCAESALDVEDCVFLDHVDQAVEIVHCPLAPAARLVELDRVLKSDRNPARFLTAVLSPSLIPWIERHSTTLGSSLSRDDDLGLLLEMLEKRLERDACQDGQALLSCLTPDLARSMDPGLAWRLAKLHLNQANHAGLIEGSRAWARVLDDLFPSVASLDGGEAETVLASLLRLIGIEHNAFLFRADPYVGLPEVSEVIDEMEKALARHCKNAGGPCVKKILGQYHGTMAQHWAFRGPEHIEQTLEHIQKAIRAFGDFQVLKTVPDCNRDLIYESLALASAGRDDEALESLARIGHLRFDDDWAVEAMDPFQIHALLRAHVDGGRMLPEPLRNRVEARFARLLSEQGHRLHPSQLLGYNLGLLAPNRFEARKRFAESLDLCLAPVSGPTIRVMALLPLAAMRERALDDAETPNHVAAAMEPVRSGELDRDHFSCLLTAKDWIGVLDEVLRNRKTLFPFSYR